jgi:glutathione S-transferase
MHIYHLAEPADWAEALETGRYERSTRGRSLAEEGFVHASTAAQWPVVRRSFYVDVAGPLLLLEIDPALLSSPVVVEVGNPATGEEFPHVYGPLDVEAVVSVTELAPPHGA